MILYKGIDVDVREYRCQSVDDKKESLEDYLLLRPKRATAHPSPARIPMNGAGLFACFCLACSLRRRQHTLNNILFSADKNMISVHSSPVFAGEKRMDSCRTADFMYESIQS